MRILFVCLGNICRSPTAEAVLRRVAEGVDVDSAGLASWHVGKAPYGPMQAATAVAGYPMSDLRARQVRASDFDDFDLILGMDQDNLEELRALCPAEPQARVGLLTDYVDDADYVPDPYYTRDFDGALHLIERAVAALCAAERLSVKQP